jgi:hypothetical protein
VLCTSIGVFALSGTPAWARLMPYGPAGTLSAPEALVNPTGVAINQATGDVYVIDQGTGKIEQFNAAGVWQSELTLGGLVAGVAVDNSGGPSEGDVYVTDATQGVVYKLDPSITGELSLDPMTPTIGGGDLPYPAAVAVDQSGNVYVSEGVPGYDPIEEYSPSGVLLQASVALMREVTGLAFSPGGTFYILTRDEVIGLSESKNGNNITVEAEGNGAAVDSEGNVFVDNATGVYEYGPQAGHPRVDNEALETPGVFQEPIGMAVDVASHTLYVADSGGHVVDIFKPEEPRAPVASTGSVTEGLPAGAVVTGMVNPEGIETEYSVEYGETESYGFKAPTRDVAANGEPVPVSEVITGLTTGRTYHYRLVANNAKGGPAYGEDKIFSLPEAPLTEEGEVLGTAVVLHGELSPTGVAGRVTYQFAYSTGESCVAGERTPLVEVAEGKEVHVEAEVPGLEPHAHYTYCLIATKESSVPVRGAEVSFQTTVALLRVTGESFSDAGSNGAVLHGQINPGSGPIESYFFEYGPTAAYGFSTAPESLGGTEEAIRVSAQVSGLAPEAEYHFRLVARGGGDEVTRGRDVVFRTRPAGLLGLPDGRVYEMVSPAGEHDAGVFVPEVFTPGVQLSGSEGVQSRLPFQASVDGDAVVYAGESSEGGSGVDSEGGGDEYLATRSAEGGWSQANIEPPGVLAARYQAFSSDLSTGILEWAENGSGEAHGPLFLRDDSKGSYSALSSAGSTLYAGASSNGSDLFMNASGLYDAVQGHVSVVNVLPDGAVEPAATFGAPALRDPEGNPPDFSGVVSADGSRVFWSGLVSGGLYVRENPGQPQSPIEHGECTVSGDACTVQLDVKAPGASGSSGGGRFWAASSDGSKVLFTDESRLTTNSTAAHGAPDLYEYQVNNEAGKPGTLTDLTVHAGEPAGVQGVLGVSGGGSYVYFVANGVLAAGASSQSCEAEPLSGEPTGGCNLYVLHEGVVSFIAALSSQDGTRVMPAAGDTNGSGEFGDWQPGVGHRTAEVTPDGRSLVFMSNRSLTGYDNDAVNDGRLTPVDEVYVYHDEDGLSCVSCDPGKEAPSTYADGAGGFLPVSWSATYLPQWVSEDGSRVFFDSSEPLAVQDTNGKQDVYEWEQDGTGSCQEQAGCVYLLSRGASPYASWLLGASTSGDDVFMITRAQLLPEEQGETYAVYDARVDGAQPPAQAGCPTTGCQIPPGLPPIFATPPSSTFEGVGNFPPPTPSAAKAKAKPKVKAKVLTRAQKLMKKLRECKRKRVSARRSCEAQAHKRYGPISKAKKSSGTLPKAKKSVKGRR